jgi:LacI family transcriptional regulator, galactose operon repressor
MSARVRISDVAAAAGVSTATVSLVLNRRDARIPLETQERVRRAAERIGYTPNSLARGLRTSRTRTIGLVSDQIATTPFAGRMIAGVQDVAREHGYLVILVDTGIDPDIERQAIRALADQQVDGMIYATMSHRVAQAPVGVPPRTVFLDCRPESGGYAAVVPDDRAGGAAATRELVEAGHRRIAYVDAHEPDHPIAADLRLEGHIDVLREAGIEPDPALHAYGEISALGGRRATERLLALPAERRPTALFCFNDRMAAGAYVAANHLGLEIPRDLSIVGYDDQQFVAAELDPPLTTLALPHYEMGRWAAEVVLGMREPDPGSVHRMECPIVRRDSVAPPPADAPSIRRRRD